MGERKRESRKREGPEERRGEEGPKRGRGGGGGWVLHELHGVHTILLIYTGRILVKQNGDKILRRDLKESVATLRQYQQK